MLQYARRYILLNLAVSEELVLISLEDDIFRLYLLCILKKGKAVRLTFLSMATMK